MPLQPESMNGQDLLAAVGPAENTPDEVAAAIRLVLRKCPDDKAAMLAVLGLDDTPLTPAHLTIRRVTHGTGSAVQAHRDAGTQLCDPCRRWVDVQRRKQRTPAPAKACGTYAAWRAHLAAGQPLDPDCEAYRDQRIRARQRKTLEPCGTPGAYMRHWKAGEPIDDACRIAHNRAKAQNTREAARRRLQEQR